MFISCYILYNVFCRCKDTLLVCSVGVIEHLVVCVPVTLWCGGVDGLTSLWTLLLHSCARSCDPGALSGAMVTMLHKLTKDENKVFIRLCNFLFNLWCPPVLMARAC